MAERVKLQRPVLLLLLLLLLVFFFWSNKGSCCLAQYYSVVNCASCLLDRLTRAFDASSTRHILFFWSLFCFLSFCRFFFFFTLFVFFRYDYI